MGREQALAGLTDVRRILAADLRAGDYLHGVQGIHRIDRIHDTELCRNVWCTTETGDVKVRGIGGRETVLASRPGGWR